MNKFHKILLMLLIFAPLSTSLAHATATLDRPIIAQQNDDDMSSLPRKFAPYSREGVAKVLNTVADDAIVQQKTGNLLKTNPKAVIKRYFRLTGDQAKALDEMDNQTLIDKLQPLADDMARGKFTSQGISIVQGDPSPQALRCPKPKICYESNGRKICIDFN
jgi:hypothetical protein